MKKIQTDLFNWINIPPKHKLTEKCIDFVCFESWTSVSWYYDVVILTVTSCGFDARFKTAVFTKQKKNVILDFFL